MTRAASLTKLGDAANALGILAPDVGTGAGKAYEAWIMLELALRLKHQGIAVLPLDHNNLWEWHFRIAGGPANMPGAGTTKGNEPCHFLISNGRKHVELHLGLQHRGSSGATHEIDISVVDAKRARALRIAGGGPYRGSGKVGLELKAFDAKHKLPQHFPRALIGIAVDLDPLWLAGRALPSGRQKKSSVRRIQRTRYAVVTTTQLYENSRLLVEHHGGSVHDLVEPGPNDAEIDRLRDIILRVLR
ncbi:hypothetical protein [Sphingopyxis fribergensis]